MGLRKDAKRIAADINERGKSDPAIFFETGKHFVGGLLEHYNQHPENMSSADEARYRAKEFRTGLRSVKLSLGYEGDSARSGAPMTDISYISELKDSPPSVIPSSILYYANIFLRDGRTFHYGRPSKGFAGIGRLLVSDYFIRRLEQEHTADVFFRCIAEQCANRGR